MEILTIWRQVRGSRLRPLRLLVSVLSPVEEPQELSTWVCPFFIQLIFALISLPMHFLISILYSFPSLSPETRKTHTASVAHPQLMGELTSSSKDNGFTPLKAAENYGSLHAVPGSPNSLTLYIACIVPTELQKTGAFLSPCFF